MIPLVSRCALLHRNFDIIIIVYAAKATRNTAIKDNEQREKTVRQKKILKFIINSTK